MHIEELKGMNDVTLYHLLANPSSDKTVKEESAFELYKRGSKYLETAEFLPYKTQCIDRELKTYAEARSTHNPNKPLEYIGRLFQKAEHNLETISHVDQKHDQLLSDARTTLEAKHENHKSSVAVEIDGLHTKIDDHVRKLTQGLADESSDRDSAVRKAYKENLTLARKLRKTQIWLTVSSLASVVGIVLHFIK
jgi:hypothetical protein